MIPVLCRCAGSCSQWGGRLNQGRGEWGPLSPGDARGCPFSWKRRPLGKPRCGRSTCGRRPPHRWGSVSEHLHLVQEHMDPLSPTCFLKGTNQPTLTDVVVVPVPGSSCPQCSVKDQTQSHSREASSGVKGPRRPHQEEFTSSPNSYLTISTCLLLRQHIVIRNQSSVWFCEHDIISSQINNTCSNPWKRVRAASFIIWLSSVAAEGFIFNVPR